MRAALALLALLALVGCASTRELPTAPDGPARQALKQNYYHVDIPTHDGKQLKATVYQPELAVGDTAPVIIATHAFGASRAPRPLSFHGRFVITGRAALNAWRNGYWVVYYDQRGWGDSEGVVHLMDPDYEVRDVSSVIDWTLEHIPAIRELEDGSPALGMIGESYGGGAQTMASFHDPRLQALVPIASWHDLNAIAPHGHVRSGWGAYMLPLGTFASGFDAGILIDEPLSSAFSGSLNPSAQKLLRRRSPVHYCENGQRPESDALFIQGFRDTVFPMQQGLENLRCFEKGGNDARLLAIQGGHILPWPVQRFSGIPLFNTEAMIHCDREAPVALRTLILDWWDEKLKGAQRKVPELCVTLHEGEGRAMERFPRAGETFTLPESWVHLPLAGLFEWLMVPLDTLFDLGRTLVPGTDAGTLEPDGGIGRPKFVPLYIAQADERLQGIPEIDLSVTTDASETSSVPFVGIGVQKAGLRRVHVASEQLTPLAGKGHYRQELPAVSRKLEDGDRIGLVIYGYSWQFFSNPSFWYQQVRLSGEVSLPIREPAPLP